MEAVNEQNKTGIIDAIAAYVTYWFLHQQSW